VVVGLYVSINSRQTTFEKFLNGDDNCVSRFLPRQVPALEDFTVHSTE
jgi:hypothetical protein